MTNKVLKRLLIDNYSRDKPHYVCRHQVFFASGKNNWNRLNAISKLFSKSVFWKDHFVEIPFFHGWIFELSKNIIFLKKMQLLIQPTHQFGTTLSFVENGLAIGCMTVASGQITNFEICRWKIDFSHKKFINSLFLYHFNDNHFTIPNPIFEIFFLSP